MLAFKNKNIKFAVIDQLVLHKSLTILLVMETIVRSLYTSVPATIVL